MLKIKASPELRATALLLRSADKATRAAIRKESQSWAPELRASIQRHARTPVDRAIAESTKVTTTAKGLRAVVGSTGRLSSGEPLRTVTRPQEFGTGLPEARHKYLSRSRSGRQMWVTRRVQRQVPRINPKGRFVYPALAEMTPKLVARYVRAVAKAVQGA